MVRWCCSARCHWDLSSLGVAAACVRMAQFACTYDAEQRVLALGTQRPPPPSEARAEAWTILISSPDMPPIKPSTPFRSTVPSGSSRDQEIAFSIPPTLNLDRATLRIHYK